MLSGSADQGASVREVTVGPGATEGAGGARMSALHDQRKRNDPRANQCIEGLLSIVGSGGFPVVASRDKAPQGHAPTGMSEHAATGRNAVYVQPRSA